MVIQLQALVHVFHALLVGAAKMEESVSNVLLVKRRSQEAYAQTVPLASELMLEVYVVLVQLDNHLSREEAA